jgi:hypothetical protein
MSYYDSGESIYSLVPREYSAPEKKKMFISSHDPKQTLTGSTFGCKGTTRLPGAGIVEKKDGSLFGPKHTPGESTSFLKKGTGEPFKKPIAPREAFESRKPPVVKASDQPIVGVRTTRNFITANAVEAILTAPRVPQTLEPNYSRKEDFGKVPAYLTQVKEEIRRENEMIDRYVKDRLGQGMQSGEFPSHQERMEELPEYERAQLVDQLKAKWDAVNASYQRMTHMTSLDTVGKRNRKEQCEKDLKDIEVSIERLTRPGPVYIK